MDQADSNHVRFDPVNLTNIKQTSDSDFDFLRDVLSWGGSASERRKRDFTYGTQFTNYPPPTSGGSSEGSSPAVSVTPLENYKPLKNPPNPLPKVPNEPDSDSDPNSSDFSSSDSSDSPDSRDVKRKKCTRKKRRSKK